MKYLFLLLLSSSVHAFPSVGDYSRLVSKDGYSIDSEMVSYNPNTKLYRARYTHRFLGKVVSVSYENWSGIEGLTSRQMDTIILHCNDWFGGELESVKLPLGNFETCVYYDYDQKVEYNLGRVPFGVVQGRLFTSEGEIKDFTLQKYQQGI